MCKEKCKFVIATKYLGEGVMLLMITPPPHQLLKTLEDLAKLSFGIFQSLKTTDNTINHLPVENMDSKITLFFIVSKQFIVMVIFFINRSIIKSLKSHTLTPKGFLLLLLFALG